MKKQRVFYLTGVMAAGLILIAVLFFAILSGSQGLNEETAVSPQTSHLPQQLILDDGWLTAVSEQVEALEYAVSGGEEAAQIAYEAPNRAHNLRTSFSETGIAVTPRLVQGDDWQVGLEIVGVGDGLQIIAPELTAHTAAANRVTMDYGDWQAWYINDVRGVEQGFTIEKPLFAQETGQLQIDMAVTGDLTPRFVDEDAVQLETAVGEQVLTYQNLVAFDAQGTELAAEMAVVGLASGQAGIRLAVDVAEADYPIVVDPLLGGGIDWVAWVEQQDTDFGFAVSTAGDVNMDGYDDVLVGAHWFDSSAANSGAVFAYYGGPDGLSPTFEWRVDGDTRDMELGYAVNPAGDVNNDGYADVIIGTNMKPTGQAFVYTGSANGLNSQPVWQGTGEQDDDGFGTAVNTAGDVNGDEFDDIIVGAPYYDGVVGADSGRAYVFYGPISPTKQTPDWFGEGGAIDFYEPGGLFGYSVSTAGDVNGDKFDDVIIGEPLGTDDGDVGVAVIFNGSQAGLFMPISGEPARRDDADWISYGPYQPGSQYGTAVGYAGDVNGDDFDDVVVGAPYYSNDFNNMGAMFVFTGTNPTSAMMSAGSPFPPWGDTIGAADTLFGYSVGTAGDVDGDGFDDVIVGAPQFDADLIPQRIDVPNGGDAFLYLGSSAGLINIERLFSNVAVSDNANVGTSVGTAGDVNGDGYADIIIGAPGMPNPDGALGEAYSLYGSGQISSFQVFNDSPTNLGSITELWVEIDEGGVLDYQWSLGDGTVANGQTVEHVYPLPGYYTAIVTGTSLTDRIVASTAVTVSESSLVNPQSGGSIGFVNEKTGFGTKMEIPPGAVSETLKISYTPLVTVPQRPPVNSLGYYFDLDADPPDHQLFLPVVAKGDTGGAANGVETAVANSPAEQSAADSYKFAVPVTVTIVYSDTGLTEEQEKSLKLLYWDDESGTWVDIAEECGLENTYMYYPDDNYYTVQVCHLSRFGVAH